MQPAPQQQSDWADIHLVHAQLFRCDPDCPRETLCKHRARYPFPSYLNLPPLHSAPSLPYTPSEHITRLANSVPIDVWKLICMRLSPRELFALRAVLRVVRNSSSIIIEHLKIWYPRRSLRRAALSQVDALNWERMMHSVMMESFKKAKPESVWSISPLRPHLTVKPDLIPRVFFVLQLKSMGITGVFTIVVWNLQTNAFSMIPNQFTILRKHGIYIFFDVCKEEILYKPCAAGPWCSYSLITNQAQPVKGFFRHPIRSDSGCRYSREHLDHVLIPRGGLHGLAPFPIHWATIHNDLMLLRCGSHVFTAKHENRRITSIRYEYQLPLVKSDALLKHGNRRFTANQCNLFQLSLSP